MPELDGSEKQLAWSENRPEIDQTVMKSLMVQRRVHLDAAEDHHCFPIKRMLNLHRATVGDPACELWLHARVKELPDLWNHRQRVRTQL